VNDELQRAWLEIADLRRRVAALEEKPAVIDWARGTFNKVEAAEYLRCSPAAIDKLMGSGLLPKAEGGYPIFTRAWLDRVIEQRMRGSVGVEEAA